MLIPDDTFQFCCVGISQAGARCVKYKIKSFAYCPGKYLITGRSSTVVQTYMD